MDPVAALLEKVGEYVRGELAIGELYKWLSVQDAGLPADAPTEWKRLAADVWMALHEHFSEGRDELGVRSELAPLLSREVVIWRAADPSRRQLTIASVTRQLASPYLQWGSPFGAVVFQARPALA